MIKASKNICLSHLKVSIRHFRSLFNMFTRKKTVLVTYLAKTLALISTVKKLSKTFKKVPIANGVEEIETVTIIDTLKREGKNIIYILF